MTSRISSRCLLASRYIGPKSHVRALRISTQPPGCVVKENLVVANLVCGRSVATTRLSEFRFRSGCKPSSFGISPYSRAASSVGHAFVRGTRSKLPREMTVLMRQSCARVRHWRSHRTRSYWRGMPSMSPRAAFPSRATPISLRRYRARKARAASSRSPSVAAPVDQLPRCRYPP